MNKLVALALALILTLSLAGCGVFDSLETPALQEGERYFEGKADFEYAESCTVSFILAADGKSVHSAKVKFVNISYELPFEGRTLSYSSGESTYTTGGSWELGAQGHVEVNAKRYVLRITFDGDHARGEMDFFHGKFTGAQSKQSSVFVGTYPFEATDKTEQYLSQRGGE